MIIHSPVRSVLYGCSTASKSLYNIVRVNFYVDQQLCGVSREATQPQEAVFAAGPHLISGLDFTILPKTYTGIHFQTRYFRGRYRRPCDRDGTIDDVDHQAVM